MQRARPSRYAIGGAGWSHCLAVAFTTAVAYSTSLEGPERGNMWKPGRSMQIYADLTTKHGKHGKHGVRGPFWRELEFGGPLHPGINRRLWPSWDVHSTAPWLHWPEFACAMRHKLQNQATDKVMASTRTTGWFWLFDACSWVYWVYVPKVPRNVKPNSACKVLRLLKSAKSTLRAVFWSMAKELQASQQLEGDDGGARIYH